MKTSARTQASRSSILDAAEKAFADAGFEGASLRQIVKDARANLATIYYHFGSKEGLMEAVLRRRFAPVHEEHFQELCQLQREFDKKPVPLEKILEAMLLPPLRLATAAGKGETIMRLIGRGVVDPNRRTQELLRRLHRDVRQAYLDAVQQSAPHLSKADLWWRFEFVWGAFIFILCNPSRIKEMTAGVCNPNHIDALLAQLIVAFSASFRAPAISKTGRPPRRAAKRRGPRVA